MRAIIYGLLLAGLSGCGMAYIPAQVKSNDPDNPVHVVMIDASSVARANAATSYTPRSLPAAFDQTAGLGQNMRGVGAIPEAPLSAETPPAPLRLDIPPATPQTPYTIGIGDVLVLATPTAGSSVEELSGLLAAQNRRQGYTVQDDGTITIPDVGRVNLIGMTISEAEAAIFDKMVQSQIDPSFSLEIAEFNSQRASIGGAVRSPAIVPITLGNVYLEEAVTAAGGFAVEDREYASIRLYRDGTLYQIPLEDYDRRGDLRRIQLQNGDSIYVDTDYSLDRAQAFFEQEIRVAEVRASRRQQALAELQLSLNIRRQELAEARDNFTSQLALGAIDRDYVYITGEVISQSRFPLPFEDQASLADALLEAGGVSPSTGNPSQIYVLRGAQGSTITAWRLDASNMVNMVFATQFELRPNDVIFVAEQPVTSWNRISGQLIPSLINTTAAAATN